MNKDKKRRPEDGLGWDDSPRRPIPKERSVEKRQNWQDYLELGSEEDGDEEDDAKLDAPASNEDSGR